MTRVSMLLRLYLYVALMRMQGGLCQSEVTTRNSFVSQCIIYLGTMLTITIVCKVTVCSSVGWWPASCIDCRNVSAVTEPVTSEK